MEDPANQGTTLRLVIYLAQPKAPTGVKLGRPWLWVGSNSSTLGPNLGVTCAELGPAGSILGPTWAQLRSNIAQLGHVWRPVGPSMCNLVLCWGIWRRSSAKDKPNVSNMASHEPASKPKNDGNSGKMQVLRCSQRVALSPQNWLGLGWAQLVWPGLPPKLGWNWAPNARWTPYWSHVMYMEIQVSSNMPLLGTFGDSFTPSWAQRKHNMGNVASNKASSKSKISWKY